MIKPTLHLNGTSRGQLLREYRELQAAYYRVMEAEANLTVHGRDYYPQGEHAYAQAREAYVFRTSAARRAYEDVSAIVECLETTP
jgi:hypothetical protein